MASPRTTTVPRPVTAYYDTSGDINRASTRVPRPTANPNIGFRPEGSTTAARTATTMPRPVASPAMTAASAPANQPNANAALYQVGAGLAGAAPAAQLGSSANNGTEPMKGWAAGMGYTPADIMGMNQMPSRYLYDILKQQGMDPTGGLFYMMEPLADVMMPLFETIYGGGRDITKGFETNEIANFMGQMFGEYLTPGGRGADVSELFGHLLNPGGENSILNSYLNTGTPEEQVENFRRYAMMAGQLSGSPMYQQALSNRLSERGYDFLNSYQGGQEPGNTFGQLVRNPSF